MTKVKAILKNPYLLGAQGFIAGALLLWSNPQVMQQAEAPTPAAAVQIVPPVS